MTPARWRGLTAGEWARLAAWKATAAGRRRLERLGALARDQRRADAWADRWRAAHAAEPHPLGRWLRRPGASALLWDDPEAARTWAAAGCTEADVRIADAAVAGRVDLLGAGPVVVAPERSARRDLYTGRDWPLDPAWEIPLVRGDGSDVRTAWEQSRGYEVVPLARAYWRTGDARYRDAFVQLVEGWLRHNPPGRGPNWASPMDLAIRTCNWAVGAVLFADAPGLAPAWCASLLASLRLTTTYVAHHLEWHPVFRGNHYVANLVGLSYAGALFRDECLGARWLRRGQHGLEREIRYQVHPDGAAFECALAYHRLDTELFAWAGEVLERASPQPPSDGYRERLAAMYAFLHAYLPDDGRAPLFGDADDGRLHAMSGAGHETPRAHRLGLPERWWPSTPAGSAAFPDGGFYVLRVGRDHGVVRCGPVGLRGAGSHDHNDHLSLTLVLGGREIVADSGTYAYTRDLAARLAFRATAAHSVVQLGDAEQNPVRRDRPWRVLADTARSTADRWEVAPDRVVFAGHHRGFADRPSAAVVRRTVDAAPERWTVVDTVEGTGTEPLTWRLHLAPGIEPVLAPRDGADGAVAFVLPATDGAPAVHGRLALPPGVSLTVARSSYSERYGVRTERACLVAAGEVALPAHITLVLTLAS